MQSVGFVAPRLHVLHFHAAVSQFDVLVAQIGTGGGGAGWGGGGASHRPVSRKESDGISTSVLPLAERMACADNKAIIPHPQKRVVIIIIIIIIVIVIMRLCA